ncbi:LacI family DNA-binding transcriptional regulator [soil metagenome]
MAKRIDMRDIAKHAGVSVGTVSNVLNGVPSVAPQYVERVRKSIDELGFVRNESARLLRSGSSQSIGLLVLSTYNPFFNSLAEAAENAVERRGMSLVLASSAQSTDREDRYLELFEQQRVNGILLAPVHGISPRVQALRDRGTPVVALAPPGDSRGIHTVEVDAEKGAFLAVSHLIETGRSRIIVVGGPDDQVSDRMRGAQRAVQAGGATLVHVPTNDLSIAEGEAVAEKIRDMVADHDGLFAFNDLVALGLTNSLVRKYGIRIPEDIAVIGHDDIEFSRLSTVELSSVRQPVAEMAERAVQLLLEGDPDHPTHDMFQPELIVRQSTAVR